MDKINKILILIVIIFILILGGGIYGVTYYIHSLNIRQELSAELQFAKDSQIQVQNKPFLSKLPIFTAQYSIYYSSLNNEIDIVFGKDDQSLDSVKVIYQGQILSTLQNIGIDTQKEKIVWLKQQ